MWRTAFLLLLVLATTGAGCGSQPPSLAEEELPDPFSDDALNFLVVGDWGRNGFFNQAEVGRAMGEAGETIGSRFTISTGDNFYTSGVTSISDQKWARSFEDIYTAPILQRPWYVVLGNHDWQGDVQAQIDYTNVSGRWTLPSTYYSTELAIDDSTQVQFFFIDTTPIADPDRAYLYPQSNLWDRSAQLTWLDSTLSRSTAAWKIAVGHHPIIAASSKESYNNNPYLNSDLLPILERHGVQIYFAGHDHNLQHLKTDDSPIHHFISGAGSLTRAVQPDNPNALFALRIPGFMAVSLTAKQMFVQAIDENNRVYYFTNVPVSAEENPSQPIATPTSPGEDEAREAVDSMDPEGQPQEN